MREYLATDVSSEMVRIGREKAAKEGTPGLSLEVGTAFEGPHVGHTFDAILAFNFIHLADDPQATIQAIFDQMKPGGYFISKSACLGEWWRVMRGVI